jgi:hypothetical protein
MSKLQAPSWRRARTESGKRTEARVPGLRLCDSDHSKNRNIAGPALGWHVFIARIIVDPVDSDVECYLKRLASAQRARRGMPQAAWSKVK